MVSLASATASASSRNGSTTATGPKISSLAARSSRATGHRTVGGNQYPGPEGALPRMATGASSGTKEATCSRWPAEMSGPIWVSSSSGSPTRIASTCSSRTSMNRSSALASTRMRERAQQSWPALANTAIGALAAARSRSASAKTMFADLPPSSSVTRLIVAAADAAEDDVRRFAAQLGGDALDRRRGRRRDRAPALGRAGERDLGDVGVLDEARSDRRAGADDHVDHALGEARLERELLEAQRGQRRELGGLEHDGVARRERGGELPRRDRQREVPRCDQPDDAQRLAHGPRLAAVGRDRVAQEALGRAGVVAERVDDHR